VNHGLSGNIRPRADGDALRRLSRKENLTGNLLPEQKAKSRLDPRDKSRLDPRDDPRDIAACSSCVRCPIAIRKTLVRHTEHVDLSPPAATRTCSTFTTGCYMRDFVVALTARPACVEAYMVNPFPCPRQWGPQIYRFAADLEAKLRARDAGG